MSNTRLQSFQKKSEVRSQRRREFWAREEEDGPHTYYSFEEYLAFLEHGDWERLRCPDNYEDDFGYGFGNGFGDCFVEDFEDDFGKVYTKGCETRHEIDVCLEDTQASGFQRTPYFDSETYDDFGGSWRLH